MNFNLANKSIPERIQFFQNIIFESLNITMTEVTPSSGIGFHSKTSDGTDVNVYMEGFSMFFTFNEIVKIHNGVLTSNSSSPIIQSILTDINKSLPTLEALRLTNDKLSYFPVLPNIIPFLVFKYDAQTEVISLSVYFSNLLKSDDFYYYLTAKHESVQLYYEPSGFKISYLLSGQLLHNDISDYNQRLLTIWDLPVDSTDIDYKRLGLLSDMLTI